MELVLATLGALLVIEGLPYLIFPGKVKEWSMSVQGAGIRGMRVMGLVAVAAGFIILSLIGYFR